MMKTLSLLLLVLVAPNVASEPHEHRTLQQESTEEIAFNPSIDYCKIGETSEGENTYGDCDPTTHFPDCNPGLKHCYHRINRRDMWHQNDKSQPHYYIDPRRVLCVPDGIICNTCTPGRYCLSKERCILDDTNYADCEEWR